ncbi:MAG TPA: hypothetical protein VFY20_00480 [Gemmatimonadales bacterium]|nr:hypothetical protein [Gemmatimonadales bacterium]
MTVLRALAWALPCVLAVPGTAAGQSVSPPIVEHRGNAKSSFVVGNESLFPLTVQLTVRGFEVDSAGTLRDVPLDTARVQVKLSTLSFRLQPRQRYTVFYEASADSLPAWFNIWSAVSGARTSSGLNLRIELPHVVYLNQKEKLAAADVQVRGAVWRPARRELLVELENTSGRIGRAQKLVAEAPALPSTEGPAFPLFPHSRRLVAVPWTHAVAPARVEVRFDGFRLSSETIAVDSTAVPEAVRDDSAGAPAATDTSARR